MMLTERHRKGGESPLQADGSDTVGRARAQRGRRFSGLLV